MMLCRRVVLLGRQHAHTHVQLRGRRSTSTALQHLTSVRGLLTASASSRPTTLPPNLSIDARSTCWPVSSLDDGHNNNSRLEEKEEKNTKRHDENVEQDEQKDNNNDDDDNNDSNVATDDDKNYGHLYSNSHSNHVIALPDRLYVRVLDKTDASQVVGTLYLSERIFGHDTIRVDLLQRTVEYQRNQKRGKRTAITKTIGQVRGSTRKVRQQKGSGNARAGHSRPAHWRGGAKAHGPKGSIQDYSNCKLNKHVRKLALTHALSQKLKEDNVILVNDLHLESHKTKHFVALLQALSLDINSGQEQQQQPRHGASCYILDHIVNDDNNDDNSNNDSNNETQVGHVPVNLTVASQNLYNVKVSNQLRANVYDILKHEKLILTVSAVTALEERLERLLRY